jgi:hypothetical protein
MASDFAVNILVVEAFHGRVLSRFFLKLTLQARMPGLREDQRSFSAAASISSSLISAQEAPLAVDSGLLALLARYAYPRMRDQTIPRTTTVGLSNSG